MAIFLLLDLAQPGSLFEDLDPTHALTGLFAVTLTSLGLTAVIYRAKRRFAGLKPDSVLILIAYSIAIWILYRQTSG